MNAYYTPVLYIPPLLHSTNKNLTGDHKFRERRYIIYTSKLDANKLNNCLNLS